MKLIIDIPDTIGKHIRESYNIHLSDATLMKVKKAIKNGAPLPKGHGRLIDVKQIVTKDECIWNSDGSCTTITTYDIDSTPTIIEADKEESEGSDEADN